MIISFPRVERTSSGVFGYDEASVQASVELETKKNLSREIWFRVPGQLVADNSLSYEPFVVGLLILAMSLGEDIKFRGSLSPRLFFGLQQYQQFFHYWFKDKLKMIGIFCDINNEPLVAAKQRGVASFFSGGVDSFYTLRSQLLDCNLLEAHRISHCIFIQGFDMPLTDENSFGVALAHYRKLMLGLGVELVPVRTNLKDLLIHSKVGWGLSHGTALGAVGLLLQSLFSRVYIPSTQNYSVTEPWGSNPIVDPMLSVEGLDFVHHGAHLSRLDKIRAISDWPVVYDSLRVCWLRPDGLNNCCRCEKCLRTMVSLDLEGVLERCSTFSQKWQGNTRRWNLVDYYEYGYWHELVDYAEELGRSDVLGLMNGIKKRSRQLFVYNRIKKKLFYVFGYAFLRLRDLFRLKLFRYQSRKN